MYERTYKGVSLLQTNYFRLLCRVNGIEGTFDCTSEDPDGTHQPCETYTIALSGRETYDVMQKVFSDANG